MVQLHSGSLLWPAGLRRIGFAAGSPRILAEFARSARRFSFPVFGVTGVAVIWLQTRCHQPHRDRGESRLDLSPFIIWFMAKINKSARSCESAPDTARTDHWSVTECARVADLYPEPSVAGVTRSTEEQSVLHTVAVKTESAYDRVS